LDVSARSLWKSDELILKFISNPPAGFDEWEGIHSWPMEKHLYLAVHSIINDCRGKLVSLILG